MLKILNKIKNNTILYVFAGLILIMFPTTLYTQSDKDKTIVVTTIGIDKSENDEYEVSILAVIPKGSNDINANLEVFSAKGKTIAESLNNISANVGKETSLAHCDCIILSKDIMKDNTLQVLDYFIRTANLTTNATLVGTDGKSQDLINATKSSNNLLDLSIKNIISFQEERSLLEHITIERFFRKHYTKSSTFTIPMLSTKSPEGGSNESSGGGAGSEGNSPQGDSGGSGGSSGSSGSQKKIVNDSQVGLIKNGKFAGTLSEEELFIYNLISPTSKYIYIEVEDINDANVNNSTEIFEQVEKYIVPHYKFDNDGNPYVEYYITLSLMLDEISSTNNYHYSAINGLNNYITDVVEKKIQNQITDKLNKTISIMQEKKYDILNLYDRFNAYRYTDFKKYLESLDTEEDFMSNIYFKINTGINFVL